MHTFSLHTLDDEHIGFLVMLPENDNEPQRKGAFAIRIINSQCQQLNQWEQYNGELLWETRGNAVELFTEHDEPIGSIQQQYLTIGGKQFILNDLTGVI